jgi:hypothetical protein
MPSKSDGDDPRVRKPFRVDRDALMLRFSAVAARTVDSFTLPRFPPRLLINKLGIPPSTLANWLTGKAFNLDADKDREGKGAHRLFSVRDAVLLSAAAQVAAVGAPFAVTKFAAEMIVAEIMSSIGGGQFYIPSVELVVFRHADAWWLVPRVPPNAPEGCLLASREIAAKVFVSGRWKDVAIDEELPNAPPVHIVFDLVSFSRHVLGKLGITVIPGTPKSVRRVAES